MKEYRSIEEINNDIIKIAEKYGLKIEKPNQKEIIDSIETNPRLGSLSIMSEINFKKLNNDFVCYQVTVEGRFDVIEKTNNVEEFKNFVEQLNNLTNAWKELNSINLNYKISRN